MPLLWCPHSPMGEAQIPQEGQGRWEEAPPALHLGGVRRWGVQGEQPITGSGRDRTSGKGKGNQSR
eukprot:12976499-Alexandrium_andersonii.AAC.1